MPSARAYRTGRVKWFNAKKGYGFITLDDGTDVFLHQTVVEDSHIAGEIIDGDAMRCTVGPGQKGQGLKAITVERHDP
jgi:CspA family cold shock protein